MRKLHRDKHTRVHAHTSMTNLLEPEGKSGKSAKTGSLKKKKKVALKLKLCTCRINASADLGVGVILPHLDALDSLRRWFHKHTRATRTVWHNGNKLERRKMKHH